jgi:hypothetical protein
VEARVPVTDLGVPPHILEAAGFVVSVDWRGEQSVSLTDADRFHSGQRAEVAAHEAAWQAHLAETRRWQEARDRAARKAADLVDNPNAGFGARYGARQEAATEAAAEYERSVPRPIFEATGKPSVPLEYVTPDEVRTTAVRRLRNLVSG